MQLHCVRLITDKTNEAGLSSDVFAISVCFTCSYSIVINKQAMEAKLVFFIYFLVGLCKSHSVWPYEQ